MAKLCLNEEITDYMKAKFTKSKRPRKGRYYKCETCGIEFYRSPALSKDNVKYCSQKCYNKYGKNNPFFNKTHTEESINKMILSPTRHNFPEGSENPSWQRGARNPEFRAKSIDWWRSFLKETIGHCEYCSYPNVKACEVHHVDRNPKNNIRENLLLLCANCHILEHYEAKDGTFHMLKDK